MKNDSSHDTVSLERRRILAAMLAGGAGLATIGHEERILANALADDDAEKPDTLSGASRTITNWAKLNDLKQKVPMSTICGVEISRMILGGNLIAGWAHSRDLIYLSDLVKAYHTREKVYATFQMAEACGINALLTGPGTGKELIAYREKTGGKMKFIADTGNDDKTIAGDAVKRAIDSGASLIYVLGEATDRYWREGKNLDFVGKTLQRIRDEGYPAGIGAHRIEAAKQCIDMGFVPDFWMQTCHHLGYWSAMPDKREHDNVFCRHPEETVEFMKERTEPWIAFKVLAAGSIHPRDGFRFAFESGADFLCVGMYDFQIVDDVNICMDILGGDLKRKRPWRTEDITEHEA